jgi:O-antigen/teichoic acid export membrane protein
MALMASAVGQKMKDRLANIGYVPILVLSMILMFVRTIVAARLLDIETFGLYSFGLLIASSFSVIGCFGFYSLLQRSLPVLLVRGQERRGWVMMNQTLLLALAGFILSLAVVLFNPLDVSSMFFVIALFTGLAQQGFMVVTLMSRSEGRTMRFANENLIRAVLVISVTLVVAGISKDAVLVLFAESAATLIVAFSIYHNAAHHLSRPRIHSLWFALRHVRKIHWHSPLTLFAAGLLSFLILNSDRWIAGIALSKQAFAMYAFAGILLTVAQSAQAVINAAMFTNLAKTYATDGLQAARQRAARLSGGAFLIGTALAIPVYLLFNLFIDMVFPKYTGAKPLIVWFLALAVFRVSNFWTSFLVIAQRERQLMALHLFTLIACFSAWGIYDLGSIHIDAPTNIAALGLTIGALNYLLCAIATLKMRSK